MRARLLKVALLGGLLIGLPLLGVLLAGQRISPYLEFPPRTRYVEHAAFSWAAFVFVSLAVLVTVMPFVVRIARAERASVAKQTVRAFPWWGWLGTGVAGAAWLIAWTRFSSLQAIQIFTFIPLWIGYVVVVNALTFMRSGRCMLINQPRYFLALFPASAVLWWFFEYLNRFVQNWYYVGTSQLDRWQHAVIATFAFATVLPAVLGTRDLLASYPRLCTPFEDLMPITVRRPRRLGGLALLVASLGLVGIGVWPDYLFWLLWVSPLLLVTALQALFGERTIFASLERGDWRPIGLSALAALVCGVFWELWNFKSLAHWEYSIPFVHCCKIFEMPLLGYAGYLPFGIECVVVAELMRRHNPAPAL